MSDQTIHLLQSLGYKQPSDTNSTASIINLCQTNTLTQSDDTEYTAALLAESRDAAIETFGAGSFCVGNISDDPDVEDVAVIVGDGEMETAWEEMVDALALDLSSFAKPRILSCDLDEEAGLIKGSKLYNLLSGLQDLQKVTAATEDDTLLLVAWMGKRKSTGTIVALLGATETT